MKKITDLIDQLVDDSNRGVPGANFLGVTLFFVLFLANAIMLIATVILCIMFPPLALLVVGCIIYFIVYKIRQYNDYRKKM